MTERGFPIWFSMVLPIVCIVSLNCTYASAQIEIFEANFEVEARVGKSMDAEITQEVAGTGSLQANASELTLISRSTMQ